MKKIFTLLALLFVGLCTTYAQDEPGEGGEEEQGFVSFWCHEWRDTSVGGTQFDGPANIVEDPTNPSNHCAHVYVRSQDEAIAAENMIADGDHIAGWDSQFFIYSETALEEGKELRLVMRVMADKPCSVGTQCHNMPGDYNHWQCFGNVEFTTEWKKVEYTLTVSADMTQSANGKEFHSIAFNLADFREGVNVYFDDVKLYMRDPTETPPQELEGWFNLLPQGTQTDFTFDGGRFHTFTGRDGMDGVDQQARIIADPVDGEPALNVTSVGYNATKTQVIIDSETGQPAIGDDGEIETEEVPVWVKYGEEKNDTITNIDNWQTQFFVTVPHVFSTGQQYKLVMWARADKPATIETQAHIMPGNYKHWDMVGQLNLTEEWQPFVFGDEEYTPGDIRTISGEQNTCQTIAFNCNVLKEVNNYYFRFDEFSFNIADIPLEERTVGTEDITIAVPEPGETPASTTVDFTNCMSALGIEMISDLIDNTCLSVQRKPLKAEEGKEAAAGWKNVVPGGNMEGEDSEEPGEDETLDVQFENGLVAATGFPLNYKGLYDDDGEMDFEVPEGYTAEAVTFNVYNNNESFKGKTADGLFYFNNETGWTYRFNVTFKGETEEVAKPGDVNEDGEVNINDVVAIINQMAGTAEWKNANVNGDAEGTVDINDVVAVINIMAAQ